MQTSPLQCLRPLPAWYGSTFGSKPGCTDLHYCMKIGVKRNSAHHLMDHPPPPDGGVCMNKTNKNNEPLMVCLNIQHTAIGCQRIGIKQGQPGTSQQSTLLTVVHIPLVLGQINVRPSVYIFLRYAPAPPRTDKGCSLHKGRSVVFLDRLSGIYSCLYISLHIGFQRNRAAGINFSVLIDDQTHILLRSCSALLPRT